MDYFPFFTQGVNVKISNSNLCWVRDHAKKIDFSEKPVKYYGEVIKPISCEIAHQITEEAAKTANESGV